MRTLGRSWQWWNSSHTALSVYLSRTLRSAGFSCLVWSQSEEDLPFPRGLLYPSIQSQSSTQVVDGFGNWRRNHQCKSVNQYDREICADAFFLATAQILTLLLHVVWYQNSLLWVEAVPHASVCPDSPYWPTHPFRSVHWCSARSRSESLVLIHLHTIRVHHSPQITSLTLQLTPWWWEWAEMGTRLKMSCKETECWLN